MSQTSTWLANKGTAIQVAADGSPTKGAGGCKRIYVGRYTTNQYRGYLNFAIDFPDDGKIVSAILTLTTDDGLGIQGDTMAESDSPLVWVRMLSTSFSEHTNSAVFETGDYTNPTASAVAAVNSKAAVKDALGQTNIDITGIVEEWAPKSVTRRNGKVGGAVAQNGIMIYGDSLAAHNYAFVSEDAEPALAGFIPYITLTYELGTTVPDAPTNLTPTGAQVALSSFQGDFTDARATDQLRYSQVQVFPNNGASGTAAITDIVSVASHGFANGQAIYFLSLTGGTGLVTTIPYYVRDKTASTFKVAATPGGAVR